jgi:alkanesulfonate monooxygenase SsuD/methylene tetrahydromethanopterin reductase-like flavin-dependent oxidoreductase (luciferase family)
VRVAGGTPVPVYVAAMGPKALQVTGELADDTLPYLAGPQTIAKFIEPAIAKSAADAGRRKPRIIAQVPALVSDDADAAKNLAAEKLSFYEAIPSYQKVIAREGVASAADLAAAGSAQSVNRQLQSYLDAGATDVVLSPLAWAEAPVAEELWAVAASL